ncbi:RagB/SusD family nutrient uptake outer membrane protein [Psychroflexus sp. CAK1W]|uniref:RagB/SusD family nutrient uptake outer membrane protein n=1 Tax=Psychroflexus curvus TaxID=2873595 RepID=UPI001CD0355B|nr:RagB/SusD family nutrient uptake outer membrane protein [Psychroflexus curvus]MBZ9628242.1 RagB/SusD family nutrient uptake outer membrane protein [Psychroflexus curvus]
MKKTYLNIFKILVGVQIAFLSSCSTEDLNPTLSQNLAVEGSITSVDNLNSILKGVHNTMTGSGYYGRDIIATNEVRSDNCFSNGNSGRFSTQAEFAYNAQTDFIWNNAYAAIADANIIINADVESLDGNLDYGMHVQGQAMILRALSHFDLLRVYGQQHDGDPSTNLGVPIVTTFKGDNLSPSRNTVDEVRNAIYSDLETAFNMMDSDFDTSKTTVSKYTAKALESRVAVYFGNWDRAIDASEAVINSNLYSIVPADSYVSSFAAGEQQNSIFELAFSTADNAGSNSLAYIYRFPGDAPEGYGDVEVVSDVINIFGINDVRRDILGYQDNGTRLRNMGKYPDTAQGSDNISLFRYEEVILNYAEALLEKGRDSEALTQLNSITANRNAVAYTSVSKDDILLERRKELMFEGLRYDDLMRTGQDIEVLGSNQNLIETLNYPNNLFVYPIDIDELNANSNIEQNLGY